MLVLAVVGTVVASLMASSSAQDAPERRERRRRPEGEGRERRKPDPQQREKMMMMMFMRATGDMPEAKAAFEKHVQALEPFRRELETVMREGMRKVIQAKQEGGDLEAAIQELKKGLLPVVKKTTQQRIKYAREVLDLAEQNIDKVAAMSVDKMAEHMKRGRRRGRREGDGERPARRKKAGKGTAAGDVIE